MLSRSKKPGNLPIMHTPLELLPAELQVQRREQRGQIRVDFGRRFALLYHRVRVFEEMAGDDADYPFVPVNYPHLHQFAYTGN